jgi:hypothetical protein
LVNVLFNKGATMIALRPIAALAGRSFEPGDVVPWRQMALAERRVHQLLDNRWIGELSQESLDFAMKRRGGDAHLIPRGLTAAGLEALGITVNGEIVAAPAAAPKKDAEIRYDQTTVHRGYALRSKQQGVVTAYDVFNAAQERLNPGGMLRGMKKVDGFIDSLEAEAARLKAKEAPAAEALKGEDYGDGEKKADPAVTE